MAVPPSLLRIRRVAPRAGLGRSAELEDQDLEEVSLGGWRREERLGILSSLILCKLYESNC